MWPTRTDTHDDVEEEEAVVSVHWRIGGTLLQFAARAFAQSSIGRICEADRTGSGGGGGGDVGAVSGKRTNSGLGRVRRPAQAGGRAGVGWREVTALAQGPNEHQRRPRRHSNWRRIPPVLYKLKFAS